ncbi:MAG: hypothetical protein WBX20_11290 [Terrimicrobiaceae bacterium]
MNLLNKSSLATELGRCRCYVSAMVRFGYRMQYGTRTTLHHAAQLAGSPSELRDD